MMKKKVKIVLLITSKLIHIFVVVENWSQEKKLCDFNAYETSLYFFHIKVFIKSELSVRFCRFKLNSIYCKANSVERVNSCQRTRRISQSNIPQHISHPSCHGQKSISPHHTSLIYDQINLPNLDTQKEKEERARVSTEKSRNDIHTTAHHII